MERTTEKKTTKLSRKILSLFEKLGTRKQLITILVVQNAICNKEFIDIVEVEGQRFYGFQLSKKELIDVAPTYFNTKSKRKKAFSQSLIKQAFKYNDNCEVLIVNMDFYNKFLMGLTKELIGKKQYKSLLNKPSKERTKEEDDKIKDFNKLNYFRLPIEKVIQSKCSLRILELLFRIASKDTGLHDTFKVTIPTTADERRKFNSTFGEIYKVTKPKTLNYIVVETKRI